MEYINSMKRVTKNDVMAFFQVMDQHRANKTVSADEDRDLQALMKKFNGDQNKYDADLLSSLLPLPQFPNSSLSLIKDCCLV
jgi:hypothetical protein